MTTEITQNATTAPADLPVLVGILAEFEDVDSVVKAARVVRDAGFTRWDVHSPFPIHGIDHAMGLRTTILPWLVLGGGLAGLLVGLGLQIFTSAIDYPFLVSGKPFLSIPAFIPIVFELTVLFAALTAVFGMFALNKLPMLYNPLFKIDRFRRVTNDRFFIVIDSSDSKFDEAQVVSMLKALGAVAIEKVED
ncbi:MAG: DUF3341 domain-containing protein [Bacillota bacterium]